MSPVGIRGRAGLDEPCARRISLQASLRMRTLLVILSLIISLVTGVGGGAPVGQDSKTEESQVAAGKPLESVDLRPAFQKMSFGPRQQGTRATCSVFTIAGAVEFAAAK